MDLTPPIDWNALGSGWTEPPLSDAELDALAHILMELGETLPLEQQIELLQQLAFYRLQLEGGGRRVS